MSNRPFVDAECLFCKLIFQKPKGDYNRAVKTNSKIFCSKSCMGKWKTNFYVHKPKEVPKEKKCKVCEKIHDIENFPKTYNKWYLNICKDCFIVREKERKKTTYLKNKDSENFKEKRREVNKTHYYKNIEKSREYSRNWFKSEAWQEYKSKNMGKMRERSKNNARHRRKRLSDSYVKQMMKKSEVEIPSDIHAQKNAIELYRIQILIRRIKYKLKKHEK